MSGLSPSNRYACQRLSPAPHLSPNAALLADLKVLRKHRAMNLGTDSPEYMSYANAISAIAAWPTKVTSAEIEAKLVPACDEKIGALVEQFEQIGRVEQAVQLLQNQRFLAMSDFTKIHGVGGVRARHLYDIEKYRSLQDVREADVNEHYFKYLEDCEKPMNREDVRSVFQFVKIQAEKTHGWEGVEIKMEICGSYRRGGEACTDVDILITMPKEDGRERGFLAALLKRLHHKRFIAPHGVLHEQHTATNRDLQQRANVPATMLDCLDRAFLVFAHPPCIPSAGGSPLRNRPILVHRRVDIVIVNCSAWGTATLAWTGSTQFNRDIRKVAMKKGWNLDAGGMTNEHGVDLPCPQETDVFRRLGLEYIPPEMRHADA